MRQVLAVTVLLAVLVGFVVVFLGRASLFAVPEGAKVASTAAPASPGGGLAASPGSKDATAKATGTLSLMRWLSLAAGQLDLGKDRAPQPGFSFSRPVGTDGSAISANVPLRSAGAGPGNDGASLTAALAPEQTGETGASARAGQPAVRSMPAEPTVVDRYAAAASGGDISAEYRLGLAYRDGNGVVRDPVASVRWLLAAARGGHAQAQIALAEMYESGTGVARDPAAAYTWFDRAASGSAAAFARDFALKQRDRIAATMSDTELATARQMPSQ